MYFVPMGRLVRQTTRTSTLKLLDWTVLVLRCRAPRQCRQCDPASTSAQANHRDFWLRIGADSSLLLISFRRRVIHAWSNHGAGLLAIFQFRSGGKATETHDLSDGPPGL